MFLTQPKMSSLYKGKDPKKIDTMLVEAAVIKTNECLIRTAHLFYIFYYIPTIVHLKSSCGYFFFYKFHYFRHKQKHSFQEHNLINLCTGLVGKATKKKY